MNYMKNIFALALITVSCLCTNLSIAQTAGADNKISQSITFHEIPNGPSVYGIFQGRCQCDGIANRFSLVIDNPCDKLKIGITFYQDSVTKKPTTYVLSIVGAGDLIKQSGGSYRSGTVKGNWTITKGNSENKNATVYQLQTNGKNGNLALRKGDENVLFILDENGHFMTGNEYFSYTLNRVELVPRK